MAKSEKGTSSGNGLDYPGYPGNGYLKIQTTRQCRTERDFHPRPWSFLSRCSFLSSDEGL